MISACMTVSVRELRTAVREWACWHSMLKKQFMHKSCLSGLIFIGVCLQVFPHCMYRERLPCFDWRGEFSS